MTHKWLASPVVGNEREQTMLDLVPLAGAGRKVTDRQRQLDVVSQLLQGNFPQTSARAVAPAAIRGNQQLLGTRKPRRPHFFPPAPNAGRREIGRVVIDPHIHPALVVRDIVDSVW